MSTRREIVEGLGDAAREGLERLVKKADDWGWKGGKPGEITGGEYSRLVSRLQKEAHERAKAEHPASVLEMSNALFRNEYRPVMMAAKRQLQKSKDKSIAESVFFPEDVDSRMKMFEGLEMADVPREWTGKVLGALLRSKFANQRIGAVAPEISNLMRPMTNDQRQAFLNLLPRWTGTLDQAATAAKKLYRRPS